MSIITIWQKEWRQFFLSPVAYVVLVVFIALAGFFFFDMFTYFVQMQSMYQMYQQPGMADQMNVNDMILTPLFHNLSVLLMLIVPLITMRLYAEEKKNRTDELLLTSPVSEGAIVWGKYLGSVSFYGVALLLTLQFPAVLFKFTSPDLGKIATGYLGLFLMGSSFLAFGLFCSTVAKTQIQAALYTFFMLLMLWILNWVSESLGGAGGKVLKYIAMTTHFEGFASGTIALIDLVYFVSFIALFLFLAVRAVESTRWR